MFTPPFPRSGQLNTDQSSLDRSERASLDSKDSTEASVEVAVGEVATENLVDVSTSGKIVVCVWRRYKCSMCGGSVVVCGGSVVCGG